MVLFGPGCKLIRREPTEARLWLGRVVVVSPGSDNLTGMVVTGEQMLVQAFIAQASVKALDKAVLHRLAWLDVMPIDLAVLAPF